MDMFDTQEMIPDEVVKVFENFRYNYECCEITLMKVQSLGYTFDYYLDAVPFNFRKVDS